MECATARSASEREARRFSQGLDAVWLALQSFGVYASWMSTGLRVAVVGATGVVGQAMLDTLARRNFPVGTLIPLASPRSAGKRVQFRGEAHLVQVLEDGAFPVCDIALFSAGGAASRQFAPQAAAKGAVVIDNSSAWRQDDEVPLCVPEVNAHTLSARPKGIIANPNCSTIQLVAVLEPLRAHFGLEQIVVSTYQAVSGGGKGPLDALTEARQLHVQQGIAGRNADLLIDWKREGAQGYTEEELKVRRETRRILGLSELKVSVNTVRVPVDTGHSEAVWIKGGASLSAATAAEKLADAPGITLVAEPDYPRPLAAAGQDPVFVGRLRDDLDTKGAIWAWIVADNLLKGAALNAVQIAEAVVAR